LSVDNIKTLGNSRIMQKSRITARCTIKGATPLHEGQTNDIIMTMPTWTQVPLHHA